MSNYNWTKGLTSAAMAMSVVSVSSLTVLAEPADAVTPGVTVSETANANGTFNTVFAYAAPEGTTSVKLIGNFQFYYPEEVENYVNGTEFKTYTPEEYEEGMYNTGYDVAAYGYMQIPMTETAPGIYSITLPLPGNEYFYDFVVTDAEGNETTVKDPVNMPFAANGADSGHSLVFVGGPENCMEGQEYVYPASEQGKVEYLDYTDVEGNERHIGVYTPAGYDESKTYPVLYLCHGGGGNEVEWFNIGAAANIYDNLIAEGEVEPTIVVTMNNTVYNFEKGASVQNITDVIIPLIEENYSVSTKRSGRAIAGLSSGASVTAQAALEANNVFDYYGIFSPSRTLNFIKDADGNNTVTEEQKAAFPSAEFYYVSVGEFDSFVRRNVNVDCYDELAADGANTVFEWKPGAHDWAVWRNQLTEFTKDYLWETFNEPVEYTPGITVEANTDFADSDAPYQVTFTYEGKADSVDVVGGFQFYTQEQADTYNYGAGEAPVSADAYNFKNGMFAQGYDVSGIGNRAYPMTEIDEEVWSVTIPVPAGTWFYAYNVTNGEETVKTLDPAQDTPYNKANGHDNGWSVFTIGKTEEAIKGQEYVFPRTDGKTGTTEFVPYTAVDGSTQYIGVYTPYGYDESKEYPVVYVSHGGGGNEVEWHFLGGTDNIMDNLVADGEAAPAIVVTMDNSYFGWNEENVNKNLMDCIIPFVEKNYAASSKAEDRAFCGLSMGGGVANQVWEHNAGDFGYIGIWSGCYPNEDYTEVENKNNPVLLLGHGCMDFAGPGFPVLKGVMDDLGVEYDYYVASGAHDWGVWRELFTVFAKDYLWDVEAAPETKPEPAKPEDGKKPTTGVNTGDTFNGGILGGMMASFAALAAAAFLALKRK